MALSDEELVSRLRQMARNQADGDDWHNGRPLTAEDTVCWAAADRIEQLATLKEKR